MSNALTRGVRVTVSTQYLADQSVPGRYVFAYTVRNLDTAWSRVGHAAYEAGLAAGAARTDRELLAVETAPLVICGRWDRLESRDDAPPGAVLVLMQETPTSGVYLACWPQVGHAKETE